MTDCTHLYGEPVLDIELHGHASKGNPGTAVHIEGSLSANQQW